MGKAEEASILGDATVEDEKRYYLFPSSYLIDGNFKTIAQSNNDQDYGGSKEIQIILSSEQRIVSVFVANRVDGYNSQIRLGNSAIYAGNDISFLSSAPKKCSQDIFDTGFCLLD